MILDRKRWISEGIRKPQFRRETVAFLAGQELIRDKWNVNRLGVSGKMSKNVE